MLESRKTILEVEERNRLNRINKLNYRELKYEMNSFSWKLVKLPNGSTKAVIIEENDKDKNWGYDEADIMKKLQQNVINIRQAIINELKVKNGFPLKVWKWCTYTREQYAEHYFVYPRLDIIENGTK
jgi:hypothetical protein